MAHKAKALVLSCIDFRFQNMIEEFISVTENAHKQFDKIAVAGASEQLVHPTKPEYKEYLLRQIDISVKLHAPDTIYLINHEDCGAYGEKNTRETHEADLREAKKILAEMYPHIQIRTLWATFNGLEEISN